MTKGEIIFRTAWTIIYVMILAMNVHDLFIHCQWKGFLQGVAVSMCVFGIAMNIVRLVKGKWKDDA